MYSRSMSHFSVLCYSNSNMKKQIFGVPQFVGLGEGQGRPHPLFRQGGKSVELLFNSLVPQLCKGSKVKTTFITFLYSSKRIDKLWWAQLGSVVWFSLRKTDKPRNNFHTFPVTNYTKNIYLNFFTFVQKSFCYGACISHVDRIWAILTPLLPRHMKTLLNTKWLLSSIVVIWATPSPLNCPRDLYTYPIYVIWRPKTVGIHFVDR